MMLWVLAATISIAYGDLFGSQDALSIEVQVERCKPGYVPNSVHTKCYKFFTEPKSWLEASRACMAEGTDLAIPRNVFDASHISNQLQQNVNKVSATADDLKFGIVGIVKWVAEGAWTDPNGVPVNSLIPWAKDNTVKQHDCSAMDLYGLLNSFPCSKRAVFFCEHKLKNEFMEYINKLVLDAIKAEEAKRIVTP